MYFYKFSIGGCPFCVCLLRLFKLSASIFLCHFLPAALLANKRRKTGANRCRSVQALAVGIHTAVLGGVAKGALQKETHEVTAQHKLLFLSMASQLKQ